MFHNPLCILFTGGISFIALTDWQAMPWEVRTSHTWPKLNRNMKERKKERKKGTKKEKKKGRKNIVSYRLNLLCTLCLPLPHITTHLWPQPMGDNAWLTLGPSLSDVNLVFLCWPPRSQEKTTVKWHSHRLPITALSLTLPMCKHTMERQTRWERWRDEETERGRQTDGQTGRQKDLLAYLGLFLFVSTHQTVAWKWQTSNRNPDMMPLVKPLFSTRSVDFWKLS